mgnify:CR=1 FL=1
MLEAVLVAVVALGILGAVLLSCPGKNVLPRRKHYLVAALEEAE